MSVIDEYLEQLSSAQKEELERVRVIVQQTVPEAEEVISYGMPGFKYNGKYLIGFAAFKNHLSIFPTAGPIEVIKDRLGAFKLSKGTIQFTTDTPIPESLIKELIASRVSSISSG
jgi:uncharacterized protein YdhG (YjbR/CyaY superfamily)